jgi:hypothetical protein
MPLELGVRPRSLRGGLRQDRSRGVGTGEPIRREFEYIRRGTLCLMAAYDVREGKIFGFTAHKRGGDAFVDLPDVVDTCYPDGRAHIVMDVLSDHDTDEVNHWFKDHPRWTRHFTRKRASWLNRSMLCGMGSAPTSFGATSTPALSTGPTDRIPGPTNLPLLLTGGTSGGVDQNDAPGRDVHRHEDVHRGEERQVLGQAVGGEDLVRAISDEAPPTGPSPRA